MSFDFEASERKTKHRLLSTAVLTSRHMRRASQIQLKHSIHCSHSRLQWLNCARMTDDRAHRRHNNSLCCDRAQLDAQWKVAETNYNCKQSSHSARTGDAHELKINELSERWQLGRCTVKYGKILECCLLHVCVHAWTLDGKDQLTVRHFFFISYSSNRAAQMTHFCHSYRLESLRWLGVVVVVVCMWCLYEREKNWN